MDDREVMDDRESNPISAHSRNCIHWEPLPSIFGDASECKMKRENHLSDSDICGSGCSLFSTKKIGATNEYPEGKLSGDDEGELVLAVSEFRGTVRIDFGKEVGWFALPPEAAKEFAELIIKRAEEIEASKN